MTATARYVIGPMSMAGRAWSQGLFPEPCAGRLSLSPVMPEPRCQNRLMRNQRDGRALAPSYLTLLQVSVLLVEVGSMTGERTLLKWRDSRPGGLVIVRRGCGDCNGRDNGL